jgi:4-amino-4-deoxy-L-arabinose transferase-like glycosyltransferase
VNIMSGYVSQVRGEGHAVGKNCALVKTIHLFAKLSDRRVAPVCAIALAMMAFALLFRHALPAVPTLRGYEAEWTATQIIAGNGFSVTGNRRHLWYDTNPAEIFPTAWVDPVFTYALAGAHWLFPEHAYATIIAANFACFALVLFLVYKIDSRFGGPWLGVVAVFLLVLHRRFYGGYLGIDNAPLASGLLLVTAFLGLRYFEQPTRGRLVALGLMTGFALLGCPAVQYLAYGMAGAVLLHHRRRPSIAVLRSMSMLALVALVVAPWAVRNYMTFGEFVLVRNGAGQMAYVGTVAAAETFMPGVAKSDLAAPWRSTGPEDAVFKMLNKANRMALNRYQVNALIATPPAGYESMNEAQRDKLYFARTKEFVREYPTVVAKMAVPKLRIFITKYARYGMGLLALALVGGLVLIRDARSWPLSLAAASYIAPFCLIVPYYDRYRMPIEPVVATLAGVGLAWLIAKSGALAKLRHRRASRWQSNTATSGAAAPYIDDVTLALRMPATGKILNRL